MPFPGRPESRVLTVAHHHGPHAREVGAALLPRRGPRLRERCAQLTAFLPSLAAGAATRRANANLPAPELGFQARLPGAYAANLRVALSCGAARRTAAGPGAVAPALARSFRARCCSGLCSDALAEPGTYFRAVVLFDGMTLHSWPVGNAIGARLKPSDMCNAARTSKLRSEGGRSRSLGGGREAHAAAAP